jgi:hypothetical protein
MTNDMCIINNACTFVQVNAAGQLIGSSDSEQHRSDGNDSDGSMLNLNEDLKPIGYYVKDRERMLQEMFRCVRGHKLQAILPDGLKVTSIESYHDCSNDEYQELSTRRMMNRQMRMNSYSCFFFDMLSTNLNSHKQVRLIIDPCFRLIHIIDQIFEQHRTYHRRKSTCIFFQRGFLRFLFFFFFNDASA